MKRRRLGFRCEPMMEVAAEKSGVRGEASDVIGEDDIENVDRQL